MNKFYFTRTSKTESLNTLEQNGPKTSKFTRNFQANNININFPTLSSLANLYPLIIFPQEINAGNTVKRLKNFRKCLKFDFNPELCLAF